MTSADPATRRARELVRTSLARVAPGPELDALSDDDDVRDALELDSLDFLSFVEQLARAAEVRIDEDDYPRLRTVSAAAAFLTAAGIG